MRVYTKAIYRWQPDGSLALIPEESESFDYEGPVSACKSAPSAPPTPDLSGAAKQTALSQMSNEVTPYGERLFSPSATAPSGFQSNITLAPQAQQTLDQQMQLSNQMGNLAEGQIGNVNKTYGTPMDLSSVQGVADKAYGAMTARLDPQWNARQQQQETQLRNQGLVPGGEAYTNSMRDFSNARNDAYQQANLGAISTMPQTYQLATSQYQQPLNQLNAIRTGAQIQNPQFSPPLPGANYLGAAQSQAQYNQGLYNSQVGQANSFNSGLFGLGAAGASAFPWGGGLNSLWMAG